MTSHNLTDELEEGLTTVLRVTVTNRPVDPMRKVTDWTKQFVRVREFIRDLQTEVEDEDSDDEHW